ncbi:short-chain fatty acid transporter [Fusobacterium sp. PH5-44]|uniref:short-chain fatty acid transporter n=1 Tax=unclassified Fusobacterium TaxID=2648384 RepID=UPI003D1D0EF2
MIKKLTNLCSTMVQKLLPDPFIFALILSAIVFCLGVFANSETPYQMIMHWGKGFWGFLGFSMQMVLVIIFGNCLATAPIFHKVVKRLALIPKTPKQAVAFVTFAAAIATLTQWGFGLVIGAILAKEVAKTVEKVDFPLLIASAYSTFLLSVLTSSITLKAASNVDELVTITRGAVTELVPLGTTSYHPTTLIALLIMLITLPLLNAAMHPSEEKTKSIDATLLNEKTVVLTRPENPTIAQRLEFSKIIPILIFVSGMTYVINHFFVLGKSLNIDIMNFILLMFGILLHKTPINYIKAVGDAARNSSGIILQFPFYAGIMGMMTGANQTGISIAGMISEKMVALSTTNTFPLLSFGSAAIVNMFVPSAGGQWAVQAPVLFPAGSAHNVSPALTTMSLCWGDTWTNMIQPFWALPALGIAKLGVRDIMGYCVMVFLWSGVVIFASILAWTFIF